MLYTVTIDYKVIADNEDAALDKVTEYAQLGAYWVRQTMSKSPECSVVDVRVEKQDDDNAK